MRVKHFNAYLAFCILTAIAQPSFATTPALVGNVKLPAPISAGRATLDGKLLAVQVQQNGQQSAGLQLIDTSDPSHPRLRGFFVLPQNGDMTLSGDGHWAVIATQTEKEQYDKETRHDIIVIDLSNPDKPLEIRHQQIMARHVTLASEAGVYAYSRHAAQAGHWETMVVPTMNAQSGIALADGEFFGVNMRLSPHGDFLANSWNGALRLWDIKSQPPKLYEQKYSGYDRYGSACGPVVFDNGYIAVEDTRTPRIGIYQVAANMPRIATLQHDDATQCELLNPNASDQVFVFTTSDERLQRLDFHDIQKPVVVQDWVPPNGTSAIATAGNVLFAIDGTSELRIYRLDMAQQPHGNAAEWEALHDAYPDIMKTYSAMLKTNGYEATSTAVESFEKAGIISLMDMSAAAPANISAQNAAAMFNDFGFLAAKNDSSQHHLPEQALRRAIALDSNRAVAHLNLADLLRKGIAVYIANGGNEAARRKEIEEHYRRYLQLGGKATPAINAFLAGDPAAKDADDICKAIADYANTGRLDELISDRATHVPMKNRMIDLIFTTDGTAHVPGFFAYDPANDFALEDKELPTSVPGEDKLWGGDNLGLLTLHGEYHIISYKDMHHPMESRSLKDDHACTFKVATQEKISPKASEPELCAQLQSSAGPASIKFIGRSPMSKDKVREAWPESEITGAQKLDFANDGKAVNVAELALSSGSGAGCEETFYETMNDTGAKFIAGHQRDLLMQLQHSIPNRYPVLPCENKPRFFTYKNMIYFETKPQTWPPVDEWNQYHRVTTISKDQVHEVCNFQFETQVTGRSVVLPAAKK